MGAARPARGIRPHHKNVNRWSSVATPEQIGRLWRSSHQSTCHTVTVQLWRVSSLEIHGSNEVSVAPSPLRTRHPDVNKTPFCPHWGHRHPQQLLPFTVCNFSKLHMITQSVQDEECPIALPGKDTVLTGSSLRRSNPARRSEKHCYFSTPTRSSSAMDAFAHSAYGHSECAQYRQ